MVLDLKCLVTIRVEVSFQSERVEYEAAKMVGIVKGL